MMKILLSVGLLMASMVSGAQLLTWSPQFPTDNTPVTITVDGSKGNLGLLGHAGPVYLHLGLITNLSNSPTDWRYVFTTWGSTTAPLATPAGPNKWTVTLPGARGYFNAAAGGVPAGETILKIAILFRDAMGTKVQKNVDGSDMYVPVYPAGTNHVQITQPFLVPNYSNTHEPISAMMGQPIPLTAASSTAAGTLNFYFNGSKIAGPVTGSASISGNAVPVATGNQQIVAELVISGASYYDTIQFYLAASNKILALPSGVQEGINYGSGCDSVTLVLYAPNKSYAVVLGDFNAGNWLPSPAFQMNRTPDGNYYWLTIKGLTAGTEYAFQYLVDNSIYIADPYSEKILDPWNDPFIPAATYPGLKPYPSNPNVSAGTNGIVSIIQTCAPAYQWQVTNFTKPDKQHLMTYELLVRDFGEAKNYQMLIDTISYFKRLGVNAIELMPVNEFSGNESWGYNPDFYLALDKAYGTKNKFKEFIDVCHKNGMAVILDVVYNHLDAFNAPQGKLYWDAVNDRPAPGNPWLNVSAPHPYSVFQDMNHTSAATQYLVKRAMDYWIAEYKIDGYRIDLAKGFTQTQSTTTTVENFDGSRVDNLFRYYDYIVAKYPGTYMILEFLGQQRQEEQLYANHGFLLWGKINAEYNQNTMGYADGSDISKIVYNSSQQGFTTPAEMGYMESHDEERLMYRNLQFGNSAGTYNVKDLYTALERQEAAAAVFFTVPGPKMIWQFGERGYDIPLEFGGSNVANKPPHWEYMSDPGRLKLWNVYSKLINLRASNPGVFSNTVFSYDFNTGQVKRFQIADTAAAGLKISVIANFDVVAQTRSLSFQNTGNWYNYVSNGKGTGINGATGTSFNVPLAAQNINLQPGEYHVYLYHPANVYQFIGSGNWNDAANWTYQVVPPPALPGGAAILINPLSGGECVLNIPQLVGTGGQLTVLAGKKLRIPLSLINQ